MTNKLSQYILTPHLCTLEMRLVSSKTLLNTFPYQSVHSDRVACLQRSFYVDRRWKTERYHYTLTQPPRAIPYFKTLRPCILCEDIGDKSTI